VSIASRPADLAYMLRRDGVPITLGAVSTYGKVAAADAGQLPEGAVALVARAIVVTIAAGSLPGLQPAVVFTVTQGPFAGSYAADAFLSVADGEVQRFTAYPTSSSAADLWVQGTILLPWARRTTGTAAGPAADRLSIAAAPVVVLTVADGAAGEEPVLEVEIHDSATEGGTYLPTGISFDPVTEDGDRQAFVLPDTVRRWFKLLPTITGDEDPAFDCGAVLLDVAVPRS